MAIHRVECAPGEDTLRAQAMYTDAVTAHQYTDVEIHVVHDRTKTVFHACAGVLASASSYFETMLANRTIGCGIARAGDPLVLRDVMPPEAFGACLRFAYTGELLDEMRPKLVAAVVLAADMLSIPRLVYLIARKFVTSKNASVVIEAACAAGASDETATLIEACAARIAMDAPPLLPDALGTEAIYAIAAAAVKRVKRAELDSARPGARAAERLINLGKAVLTRMRLPLCDLHAQLVAATDTHAIEARKHTTNLLASFNRIDMTRGLVQEHDAMLVNYYLMDGTRLVDKGYAVCLKKTACGVAISVAILRPHPADRMMPQLITIRCADRATRAMITTDEDIVHLVERSELGNDGSLSFEVEVDALFALCNLMALSTFQETMALLFATIDSRVLKWLIDCNRSDRVKWPALLLGAVTRPTSHADRTSIGHCVIHSFGTVDRCALIQLLTDVPALFEPTNKELLDQLVKQAIAEELPDDDRAINVRGLQELCMCISSGAWAAASHAADSKLDSQPKRPRIGL